MIRTLRHTLVLLSGLLGLLAATAEPAFALGAGNHTELTVR